MPGGHFILDPSQSLFQQLDHPDSQPAPLTLSRFSQHQVLVLQSNTTSRSAVELNPNRPSPSSALFLNNSSGRKHVSPFLMMFSASLSHSHAQNCDFSWRFVFAQSCTAQVKSKHRRTSQPMNTLKRKHTLVIDKKIPGALAVNVPFKKNHPSSHFFFFFFGRTSAAVARSAPPSGFSYGSTFQRSSRRG